MRIVIDLQGAQTESRFRGIGRYSLSLAKAIARNAGEHEIWLALNGAFTGSVLSLRDEFEGLIPQERIRVFEVPLPVAEHESANSNRARVAELIRECFLEQLNPDVVLVTSLFEGYVDDAVTSVGMFAKSYKTAVILYDLIPYMDEERYLPSNIQREYYHKKINSLQKADMLLAISEASKKENENVLHISPNIVTNISTAVDETFAPANISVDEKNTLFSKYGITKKMVMYAPGGFDIRKNFENLIIAYSKLSNEIRDTHQLVIVSKVQEGDRYNLENIAKNAGLKNEELIITGYVSDDELIAFYSTCTLFVFPSLHEGFGLPALEAMACGAAVIGSNTTSVPEVIGYEKALFDPKSVNSISAKIREALEDEMFLKELQAHSLVQAKRFSWDQSAKRAIETMVAQRNNEKGKIANISRRKLAYFSPLPPQRSGISDYSKELLPYLNEHYEIILIVGDEVCENIFDGIEFEKRDLNWFEQNAHTFERILFHIGNNPFHTHMLELLRKHSGVVMLHDFFLSGMYAYEEMIARNNTFWSDALFHSHGYMALQQRCTQDGEEIAKQKYPVNLEVLQNAKGMLFHSAYSKELIIKWHGEHNVENFIIPHLRVTCDDYSKIETRKCYQFDENSFIVCSFGFLDSTKLNHKLIKAWQQSKLSSLKHCKLIFVGENHGGEYGMQINFAIAKNKSITITGWTESQIYSDYLKIADVGVQLRAISRGETSGTVLDCMNYGLATIVNANGSFKDLPTDSVYMLEDEFELDALVKALEKLYDDNEYRSKLSNNAIKTIKENHSPKQCAKMYYEAIESSYQRYSLNDVIKGVVSLEAFRAIENDESALLNLSSALSKSIETPYRQKQILVDVSAIYRTDLKTGIERVVRAQLLELMKNQPQGYRVEPIYLSHEEGKWTYRYAREYTLSLLGIHHVQMQDEIVGYGSGDIYYGADFYRDGITDAIKQGLFCEMQLEGIGINFLIYDLLPITHPEFFPEDSNNPHQDWFEAIVSVSTNLICISKSVADEVKALLKEPKIKVSYNHLGADIRSSLPSAGLPSDAKETIDALKTKPTFLIVGTIEPRKGHLQILDVFERLWNEGYDINLVIVGKEGWRPLPDNQRRTIPQIVSKMNEMRREKRFFWLEGISDEYLEKVYEVSTCLIAASEGEGFGLPLIEAAQYKKPIIARDIPVFREVAGKFAYYFDNSNDSTVLEKAIKEWLEMYRNNEHPKSYAMPWLTWEESSKQLMTCILEC